MERTMPINNQCADYCIAVIRAVMREREVPAMPQDISLQELFDFAKMHSVEALVYHGLCELELNTDDSVWMDWEKRANMLLTQSIVQLAERDILFEALPAAGVRLLPVKGCWLKEQYPDIDYRQMSDLDMLIHPEDAEKAEAVMLELGYEKEEGGAENHDGYSKPPYMGVELHLSLLPEEYDFEGYYDTVWERAVSVEGYPAVYRLKPEDEYIFYLLHLRKHVLFAGTGIKSYLDSAVYRMIYPNMDDAYLLREYEKLGLTEFVSRVEALADCWFVSGVAVPQSLENMANNVLCAGTYGTETQREILTKRGFWTRYRNPTVGKLMYLLSCLFLPLEAMQELYPVLKKVSVLLPVMWIWRPVAKMFTDPKALKNRVQRA
ncbi:MAG: nucleotidyltransferase family protein, partial [Oscillospiraceae bacterium]|nr:nucleotidyltransferase family protein [Oscillospiraceae bacterium]